MQRIVREFSISEIPIINMCYSNDGTRFFASRVDGIVQIFDTQTGQELFSLPAHTGAVIGLAMDHDDKMLYTSGTDGELRVWSGK